MPKKEKIPLLFIGLMVVIFPLARFSGMVYQAYRGGGVIQGNCVAYNTINGQVYAPPFNMKCLNFGDWLLLATALLSPICGGIFYFTAKTKNPLKLFRSGFTDKKTDAIKFFPPMDFFPPKKDDKVKLSDLKLFSFCFDASRDIIRDEDDLKAMAAETVIYFLATI